MTQDATPTNVAQAISRVLDAEPDLYVMEEGTLRIKEIGAQLHHLLGGNVEFQVKTTDGKTFTVRVSED